MPVLSKELAAKNILELFARYQSGEAIEPDEVTDVLSQWTDGEDMPKPVRLATFILAPLTANYLTNEGSHEISTASWQALRPKEAKSGFHWALILKKIQDENPGISIDDAFLFALPHLLTDEEKAVIEQAQLAASESKTQRESWQAVNRINRRFTLAQLVLWSIPLALFGVKYYLTVPLAVAFHVVFLAFIVLNWLNNEHKAKEGINGPN
jgi:hypothetical protein